MNQDANKLETTPRRSLKLGMLQVVSGGFGNEWDELKDEPLCNDESD